MPIFFNQLAPMRFRTTPINYQLHRPADRTMAIREEFISESDVNDVGILMTLEGANFDKGSAHEEGSKMLSEP
jgi:hypothetical protein